MKLTKEIKKQIKDEFNSWKDKQYAGKSLEERQEFGQFFTSPELTIKMIEKFNNLDGTILDPCAGCGGLLVACIIAGANPENIYGIELDPEIYKILCDRLTPYGVKKKHLYLGDALQDYSYDFEHNHKHIVEQPLF